MYEKESDFVRALITKLSSCGLDVTRIESHGTGNGIPDMYVQGYGYDFWIECKNIKSASIFNNSIKIPWRPGQQGWAFNYYKRHLTKKNTLTIVSVIDGFIIIRHDQVFENNFIDLDDANRVIIIPKPEWRKIDLLHELIIATTNIDYSSCKNYRDALLKYAERSFGMDMCNYDWDPEVIFNAARDRLQKDRAIDIRIGCDDDCKLYNIRALERYIWYELQQVFINQL